MNYPVIALLEREIAARLFGWSPSPSNAPVVGRSSPAPAPFNRRSWTEHVFDKLARTGTAYRRRMRLRQDAAYLSGLDDYLLRDIGLTRYEIDAAVQGRIPRDRLAGEINRQVR
jgi:uncharacterized protein YjiS (DUF1127 family)